MGVDKEKDKEVIKEDEIYNLPDDKWDFYSGLPNPSAYMVDEDDEEWDEDHALDMVLNGMIKDLNDADDEDFDWHPDTKT